MEANQTERKKQHRRSKLERRQIVEESLKAGTSVAVVARANGVNEPARYPALTFQELAKEALRCPTVAPRLNKNIDHVAVLIHGAPTGIAVHR